MRYWIFQGNPDLFDIDTYVERNDRLVWTVRQAHFAPEILPDDEVFIWRAAGAKNLVAGVVARCVVEDTPSIRPDDAASQGLWTKDLPQEELRVALRLKDRCTAPRSVVKRDWLKEDPVLRDLGILKVAIGTVFPITASQAQRLAALVRNTGRDWTREESLAALWAYHETKGQAISQTPGSPVAYVAVLIGRVVGGVYNKVMNFRSIDPTDQRAGLGGINQVDQQVWDEFFDRERGMLNSTRLETEFRGAWERTAVDTPRAQPRYADFGEAPNDDPEELEQFAAKVRRGQPKFRRNLLAAYGGRCCISGTGPDEVLEAVHILSHAETGLNELANGLLLRSDLHALFDAGLINVEPATMTVEVSQRLRETTYWPLNGAAVHPHIDGTHPNREYLARRFDARPERK